MDTNEILFCQANFFSLKELFYYDSKDLNINLIKIRSNSHINILIIFDQKTNEFVFETHQWNDFNYQALSTLDCCCLKSTSDH